MLFLVFLGFRMEIFVVLFPDKTSCHEETGQNVRNVCHGDRDVPYLRSEMRD